MPDRRVQLVLLAALLCAVAAGCRSRWAMRDPLYAAKYPNHSDKPRQIVKQALDARHVKRKEGHFFAGGVAPDGQQGFVELGTFLYDRSWTESQFALNATYSAESPGLFFGGHARRRWQLPTRGAPFVGVGVGGGTRVYNILCAIFDEHDDEDDTPHTDWSCRSDWSSLGEIYPEVGFHFWPHAARRWTVSAAYHVTTEGRKQDFLSINVAMSRLHLQDEPKPGDSDYRGWLEADNQPYPRPDRWWWEQESPAGAEISRLPPIELD